jgi:hypothetical protein
MLLIGAVMELAILELPEESAVRPLPPFAPMTPVGFAPQFGNMTPNRGDMTPN